MWLLLWLLRMQNSLSIFGFPGGMIILQVGCQNSKMTTFTTCATWSMIWHEQIVICAVKWASQLQTIPLRRISTVVEYWKKSVTSSCYLMSASRWATIPSGSWIRIFFPAIKYIILSIQIYLFISQIHNHSVYEFCLKLFFFLLSYSLFIYVVKYLNYVTNIWNCACHDLY